MSAPRKSGSTVKTIRKALDRRWREIVVSRSDGRCELCGAHAYCGHHIFTRGSSLRTRWDPENGIALCIRCHYAVHSSNLTTEYQARIHEYIGSDRFERIRARHHERVNWRKADFEAMLASLS